MEMDRVVTEIPEQDGAIRITVRDQEDQVNKHNAKWSDVIDISWKEFENEIVVMETKRWRVENETNSENQEVESRLSKNVNEPKNLLEAGTGLQAHLEQ